MTACTVNPHRRGAGLGQRALSARHVAPGIGSFETGIFGPAADATAQDRYPTFAGTAGSTRPGMHGCTDPQTLQLTIEAADVWPLSPLEASTA